MGQSSLGRARRQVLAHRRDKGTRFPTTSAGLSDKSQRGRAGKRKRTMCLCPKPRRFPGLPAKGRSLPGRRYNTEMGKSRIHPVKTEATTCGTWMKGAFHWASQRKLGSGDTYCLRTGSSKREPRADRPRVETKHVHRDTQARDVLLKDHPTMRGVWAKSCCLIA